MIVSRVLIAFFVIGLFFGLQSNAQNDAKEQSVLNSYSRSHGDDQIYWSKPVLDVTLFPGDTVVKSVQVFGRSNLGRANVYVTGSLMGVISLNKSYLDRVYVSSVDSLVITFHVPESSRMGVLSGEVYLWDGPVFVEQRLRLRIRIGLPPDPGVLGKQTLGGIDSDEDGVRDDVQRYIAFLFEDSAKTRAALYRYAKVTQDFIVQTTDKNTVVANAINQDMASDCLFYIRPQDAYKIIPEVRSVILNTLERSLAYIKADSKLSGVVFEGVPFLKKKEQCAFDPDLVGN